MRVLAIGDVHGCLTAFDTLLRRVLPTPEDLIVTLGDYVDRGPDSRGVLERLIELHATGRLVALRGNHDDMVLAARESRESRVWMACGGRQTLESYGLSRVDPEAARQIPERHTRFLADDCRDWYETEGHLFAHAAVEPGVPMADQPHYVLHWEKLEDPVAHFSGKVLVVGHTRQPDGRPRRAGMTVWIDTGAYASAGWLTCLDVTSGEYWQANQRRQTRGGWLGG